MRTGNPLAGEFLEIFDGVFRRKDEEFAHDMNAFIVGDVDGGGVVQRFAVEILFLSVPLIQTRAERGTHMGKPSRNDSRGQGRTQCDGLEWHYVLVGTIYKAPGVDRDATTKERQ